MGQARFLSEPPPAGARARFDRGVTVKSQSAVEQRLASAERELRVQFSRIAQLQAELDLLRAAFRRSPAGSHMR